MSSRKPKPLKLHKGDKVLNAQVKFFVTDKSRYGLYGQVVEISEAHKKVIIYYPYIDDTYEEQITDLELVN